LFAAHGYRRIAALNGGSLGDDSRLIAKAKTEPTSITSEASWFNGILKCEITKHLKITLI